jgi:hypothetical protein
MHRFLYKLIRYNKNSLLTKAFVRTDLFVVNEFNCTHTIDMRNVFAKKQKFVKLRVLSFFSTQFHSKYNKTRKSYKKSFWSLMCFEKNLMWDSNFSCYVKYIYYNKYSYEDWKLFFFIIQYFIMNYVICRLWEQIY